MKKSTPLPRWRIIEIANKGRHVATLRAADADAAIRMALEEYEITDPHRQRRPVAQPID